MIIPSIRTFDNETFEHNNATWSVLPGQFDAEKLKAVHIDDLNLEEGHARRTIWVPRSTMLAVCPPPKPTKHLLAGIGHIGIYNINRDEEEGAASLGFVHIEDHTRHVTFFGRLIKDESELEKARVDLVCNANMQPGEVGLHTIIF